MPGRQKTIGLLFFTFVNWVQTDGKWHVLAGKEFDQQSVQHCSKPVDVLWVVLSGARCSRQKMNQAMCAASRYRQKSKTSVITTPVASTRSVRRLAQVPYWDPNPCLETTCSTKPTRNDTFTAGERSSCHAELVQQGKKVCAAIGSDPKVPSGISIGTNLCWYVPTSISKISPEERCTMV